MSRKSKMSSTMMKSEKFDDYDYEASFNQNLKNLSESFIDSIFRNKHVGVNYAVKTITSGNLFEVEIYPYFKSSRDLPKGIVRRGESSEVQRNLNDKNSRKRLRRLVHNNFGPGDYWVTFTFKDEDLPGGFKDLKKIRKNFFARLNRYRKKKGLENARYIYVEEEGTYGTERYHIHMVLDGDLTKEEIESKWKHGRVNIRTINYHGDNTLLGLCNYLVKDPEVYKKTAFRVKGKREWGSSKGNLKLPTPRVNKSHDKFNKKKVNYMARNHNSVEEMMESAYPNYYFKEAELRYNEENGLFYIYVIMHDKRNTKARR